MFKTSFTGLPTLKDLHKTGRGETQYSSYNRHKFSQKIQKEGESVAQFVVCLRQLTSAFSEFLDDSVDSFYLRSTH